MAFSELEQRIRRVKLVLVDNDGVLTDGRVVFGDYGDELKFFDIQDGFGMVLLRRAGLATVMISGRKSRVNARRAKEMQIVKIYQNAFDKLKVFEKVLQKFRVTAEETCYVGDDLIDLPVMRRAGFAAAPANAVEEVKRAAHYVTQKNGGRGAVREVAELLLKTQDRWDELMERYSR